MFSPRQFSLLTGLGLLLLTLAASTGYAQLLNRTTRQALMQRQLYLQQTAPVDAVYRDLAKALAELAVKNRDHALADLLGRHGIRIAPAPQAAPRPGEQHE